MRWHRSPEIVCGSVVDRDGFPANVLERHYFRGVILDQKRVVRVEITLDEQYLLGTLVCHRRRSDDEFEAVRVQPCKHARPLLVDDLIARPAQTARKLFRQIDIEAFGNAIGPDHGMRGEADVGRNKQRTVFGQGRRGLGVGGAFGGAATARKAIRQQQNKE